MRSAHLWTCTGALEVRHTMGREYRHVPGSPRFGTYGNLRVNHFAEVLNSSAFGGRTALIRNPGAVREFPIKERTWTARGSSEGCRKPGTSAFQSRSDIVCRFFLCGMEVVELFWRCHGYRERFQLFLQHNMFVQN